MKKTTPISSLSKLKEGMYIFKLIYDKGKTLTKKIKDEEVIKFIIYSLCISA